MILEVDTRAKTIKVKGSVQLGELMTQLHNMFPDFQWEEYTMMEYPAPIYDWVSKPYIHTPSQHQGINPFGTGNPFPKGIITCEGTTGLSTVLNTPGNYQVKTGEDTGVY